MRSVTVLWVTFWLEVAAAGALQLSGLSTIQNLQGCILALCAAGAGVALHYLTEAQSSSKNPSWLRIDPNLSFLLGIFCVLGIIYISLFMLSRLYIWLFPPPPTVF